MTSIELSALFQSEGTVQLEPEVRKIVSVPAVAFARGMPRTNMPTQNERTKRSAMKMRGGRLAERILPGILAEDFW
jgi:hypothetical protein